ncbi:MAG TPA: hypothetical protein VN818_01785 [Gammaproteobacteria bacterium]|nr:hypothetical protein [Gammaproteobacteria bacterium]
MIHYSIRMKESRELAAARAFMAEAEAGWAEADGLARLADGLERLADIIESGAQVEARRASNLAASYAGRFYARVRDKLERDAQVPEPELEHYFKVVLAFDQVQSALPAAAAELKIGVVKALIERYYEGHPPEKKRAALEQLAALRPGR